MYQKVRLLCFKWSLCGGGARRKRPRQPSDSRPVNMVSFPAKLYPPVSIFRRLIDDGRREREGKLLVLWETRPAGVLQGVRGGGENNSCEIWQALFPFRSGLTATSCHHFYICNLLLLITAGAVSPHVRVAGRTASLLCSDKWWRDFKKEQAPPWHL